MNQLPEAEDIELRFFFRDPEERVDEWIDTYVPVDMEMFIRDAAQAIKQDLSEQGLQPANEQILISLVRTALARCPDGYEDDDWDLYLEDDMVFDLGPISVLSSEELVPPRTETVPCIPTEHGIGFCYQYATQKNKTIYRGVEVYLKGNPYDPALVERLAEDIRFRVAQQGYRVVDERNLPSQVRSALAHSKPGEDVAYTYLNRLEIAETGMMALELVPWDQGFDRATIPFPPETPITQVAADICDYHGLDPNTQIELYVTVQAGGRDVRMRVADQTTVKELPVKTVLWKAVGHA